MHIENIETGNKSSLNEFNLLRYAVDNATDCIFAKDHKFRLILVNKSLALQMNMMPDEMENHYDNPENSEVIRKLTKELVEYADEYEDWYVEVGQIKAGIDEAIGR